MIATATRPALATVVLSPAAVAELIATPDNLEAWLRARPLQDVAGLRGHPEQCPIARWLRAVTGRPWRVGKGWLWARHQPGMEFAEITVPDWVIAYIDKIDRSLSKHVPVTVGSAIWAITCVRGQS